MKYKVEDVVVTKSDLVCGEDTYRNNNGSGCLYLSEDMAKSCCGKKLTITKITPEGNYKVAEVVWTFSDDMLVSGKKTKLIVDDLVRYMVYGTGCDNKTDFIKSEKELKAKLVECSKDSSWSGRVIGYKLTPLFEAIEKTSIKSFKLVKNKRGKPKKA